MDQMNCNITGTFVTKDCIIDSDTSVILCTIKYPNDTSSDCIISEPENNCCNSCDGKMIGLFFGTIIPVLILLGVAIGLILWKRIKVAEFLYNLQLPKVTELPQFILRRWRPPTSTPPPEVYDEHILHNPTYDMEEGRSSGKDAKAAEAHEPVEVYEEIPNQTDLGDNFDVYDIPECEDNLVAYAMTDVSGKEMFDAYAVTDISQTELQCNAYAMTGSQDGNLVACDTRGPASSQVRAENRSNSSSSDKQSAGQVSSQKDMKKMKSSASIPSSKQQNAYVNSKGKAVSQPNGQKQPAKSKPPISSAKPSLRPSNRKESKEKIAPAGASDAASDAHRIRVMFKDEEDRRRSQSYAGDLDGNNMKPDGHASTRSSVRNKPKPLPKKKGKPLKDTRERGASDSGVQEYSKLNAKTQYASLEPHVGKETNPIDNSTNNFEQESYSHLKR